MVVLASARPVAAQEPLPDRGVRWIQLTDRRGYLEFVTRQREHEQESKVGAGRTEAKESIFEENFKLELDGYIYHPNFLEFSAAGLFGLRQHDFERTFGEEQHSSGDDGTVIEFDLEGRFMKKKKYPGTAFARRYQALEPRPFQSSIETTTTSYGVLWQYVSEKMPTNFQFTTTEVLLNPLGGDEADGRQENTNLRFETGYNLSEHNALSFLYDRQSIVEEPFALDYDSDELTLGHRWDFGQQHAHRLESELNYFDQRGTFEIKRARWRETLRLQHTDDLRSWYRFETLDREQGSLLGVPPIQERSYLLAGTIEHELYESLVSQLGGWLQTQDFETGLEIDRFGLYADLDYRKKNPWGVLRAHYRPRLEREDRKGADRDFEVFRARHSFRDPDPITLSNPNIRVSSIRITAEDTITIYQTGRDYTVRQLVDRLEIWRVPTGRIADGQTVLIDYVFSSGGSFELDTLAQDFELRHNFKFGLTPYYRLRWQDQTISPATATGARAEDITGHTIGAEFERWSLRLTGEYEDRDSTINPFEAIRLGASYMHRFKFGATTIFKVRWTDTDYHLPVERQTTFLTAEARYRHPITAHLTVEGAGRYRTIDDTLTGEDEGIDVDLSLEWKIRQTEVKITYEFGQFEDDFAQNDNSMLYVQVRRHF